VISNTLKRVKYKHTDGVLRNEVRFGRPCVCPGTTHVSFNQSVGRSVVIRPKRFYV